MPEVCSKLYVERTLRIFDHTKKTTKSGHSQMPRGTGISIYLTTCPKIQAIHVGKYTYHSSPGSSKTPPSLKRSVSVSRKNPMDVFSPWIWPKKHRTLFRRWQKRWNKSPCDERKGKQAFNTHTQNRDTHTHQPTKPNQPTQPNHIIFQILPPPFHPQIFTSADRRMAVWINQQDRERWQRWQRWGLATVPTWLGHFGMKSMVVV